MEIDKVQEDIFGNLFKKVLTIFLIYDIIILDKEKERLFEMTVNQWIDENIKLLHNRKIRLLDKETHVGYTEKMLAYMGAEVKETKVTSKFIFIFI